MTDVIIEHVRTKKERMGVARGFQACFDANADWFEGNAELAQSLRIVIGFRQPVPARSSIVRDIYRALEAASQQAEDNETLEEDAGASELDDLKRTFADFE